jgi:hypothetical protein
MQNVLCVPSAISFWAQFRPCLNQFQQKIEMVDTNSEQCKNALVNNAKIIEETCYKKNGTKSHDYKAEKSVDC